MLAPDSNTALTSKSMLSRIDCSVLTLPQTLSVGDTMLPIGLPTPVPKQMSWQPPMANAVRFSTAGAKGRP